LRVKRAFDIYTRIYIYLSIYRFMAEEGFFSEQQEKKKKKKR
tara:strand:+ start:4540 stop:4665 length:126 start_codon:yes stop_codon:yes gene_type:complete